MTPAMVERWYIAGLIPHPQKEPREKGRGTVSRFPAGTVEQARELHGLLGRYRSFHKAAIVLYLRGYPVHVRALRDALAALLDGAFKAIEAGDRASADRWAETVSGRKPPETMAARRQDELQRAGGADAHQEALASIGRPLTGEVQEESLIDTLSVYGLAKPAAQLAALAPELVSTIATEAQAGRLSPRYVIEDAIPKLTLAHFLLLARFLAVVLRFLEPRRARGIKYFHPDPFVSDCLEALRHKRWEWKPVEIPQPTEEVRP